jgi:hypothetical protein
VLVNLRQIVRHESLLSVQDVPMLPASASWVP